MNVPGLRAGGDRRRELAAVTGSPPDEAQPGEAAAVEVSSAAAVARNVLDVEPGAPPAHLPPC